MSEHDISLTVNETEHDLTVEARTLLVHALRDELGYTGPNVGCESSMCGACTVHVDGKAVKSCTVLAVQADGSEVTTVEGLTEPHGPLHPIQESFREEHGLQCGYCTPGMIMTTKEFLGHNPDPDEAEIREALEGNLCRCTGYQNIVRAVETAADKMRGETAPDGGGTSESKTDGGRTSESKTDGGTPREDSTDAGETPPSEPTENQPSETTEGGD